MSKVEAHENPLEKGVAHSVSTTTITQPDPISSKQKTESLTIRPADEIRIVAAMQDAAKKKTSGTVFSVRVDIRDAASLQIGVKDLADKLLTVSMLKRINSQPGPVEKAGVRLGDIIFGVNFQACREGSRTLVQLVKRELDRKRPFLHLQVRMVFWYLSLLPLCPVLAMQALVFGQCSGSDFPPHRRRSGSRISFVSYQSIQ